LTVAQRSYWYAHGNEYDEMADNVAGAEPQCVDPAHGACAPFDMPLLRKSRIDAEYTDETLCPRIRNGVKLGEGDGTVSLVSLGSMCVEGWTRKRWNPAGIKITTVEVRV
jgi:phospholipid:diacylglycerol acyltransferase